MKIASFGARGLTTQIERVEEGFRLLGHEISYEDPDICYSNNALYDDIINFSRNWPRAKKIFTCLDIPHHNCSYPFDTLKQQLLEADRVCSISKTVALDLLETFNIESEVIYNPAKPVFKIEGRETKVFGIYVKYFLNFTFEIRNTY